MKLYLSWACDSTRDGEFKDLLGVFSNKENALNELQNQWRFKQSTKINDDNWKYVFDGELTIYYSVEEINLDEPMSLFNEKKL